MATELRKLGATVEEGADFLRDHAAARAGAPARHRHLRRPPHGDVLLAGRVHRARRACRCASTIRSASPRPFPTTSRRCSSVVDSRARATFPVIAIDGPTASGKGTVAAQRRRTRSATTTSTRGALYRAGRARRAARRRRRRRRARARRARRARCDLRFDGGRDLLDGDDVTDAHPRARTVGDARLARSSACPRVRARAARRCSWRFRRLPGLVADGRDMGTVDLPRRRRSRCS